MANEEMQVYDWDEVPDENVNVTEEDHTKSDDIGFKSFLGKGMYKVVSSGAVEASWLDHTPWACQLEFELIEIIEAEMPLIGEDKKPITKDSVGEDGEPVKEIVKRIRVVTDIEKANLSSFLGFEIDDKVLLPHVKNPKYAKPKRLNVAKAIGVMSRNDITYHNHIWRDAPGKTVILTTIPNRYQEKTKNEKTGKFEKGDWVTKGVKLAYDGYESVNSGTASKKEEVDVSGI